MSKYLVGIVVLVVLGVCGATSYGQSAPTVRAAARRSHAAWYVGSTSAGTRMDFRLSPSGLWVRDFDFGSPLVTCSANPAVGGLLADGSFPLSGLRIRHGTFRGNVHPADSTPSDPPNYQAGGFVFGSFIDQRHVTGTVTPQPERSCYGVMEPLTFTATRVRSLPSPPTKGGRYAGQILGRSVSRTTDPLNVRFRVSGSGRQVTAFRIARIYTDCKSGPVTRFRLAHSYPAAGVSQNRVGVFTGTLVSRLTPSGRPAGIRVRVSVLFLSAREATGTVRLLSRGCAWETLAWRAALVP